MLDLAQEIREYVDATPAVQLHEVAPFRTRRHRPVLVVSAAAVLACVVALTLVAKGKGDRPGPLAVEVGSQPPAECHSGVGCPMQPEAASKWLGFGVREPTIIPAGWVQVRESLRQYDSGAPPSDPHHDVRMFRLLWTPPGEDLNAPGRCASYLQIDQRRAGPNEKTMSSRIEVGNGRSVGGFIHQASTCGTSGETSVFAFVGWFDHGVWFRVMSSGVEREQLLRIVKSLQR
jgi:hypothetical protein